MNCFLVQRITMQDCILLNISELLTFQEIQHSAITIILKHKKSRKN